MDTPLPPAPEASPYAPHQTLLVVVDDLEPHRSQLCALLGAKASILTASSGTQALDAARDLRPDLILLDMQTPDMNGLQVLQTLKDDPDTRDIAVIAVTTQHDPQHEVRTLTLGAADYITKPVPDPVIAARVASHLRAAAKRRAMLELVFVDKLTSIPNRRYFEEMLRLECGKAQRTGRALSVGMVDVDFFKQYNDRYGHMAGDGALRAVAQSLRRTLRRSGDFVARFGGEEFALILSDSGNLAQGFATTLAQAACDAVRALGIPHEESAVCPVLTVSVGMVTAAHVQGEKGTALLERADQCLYAAKESGRNRVVSKRL